MVVIVPVAPVLMMVAAAILIDELREVTRAGSGNLDSWDKWIFCLNAA